MIKKGFSVLGMGILFALLLSMGEAPCETAEEVMAEIAARGASMRTFAADFVQEKESDLFATPMTSRGRLVVNFPDLLLWQVKEPLEAVFFLHGEIAGTRDPKTGEMKRWNVGQEGQSQYGWLFRALTGSFEQLRRSFAVALQREDEVSFLLRLLPLEQRGGLPLQEILMGFDRKTLHLTEILLTERPGERTRIRLEGIEINGDIRREIPSWLQDSVKP
jgi:outer membrane lipoprotein-sorting protein